MAVPLTDTLRGAVAADYAAAPEDEVVFTAGLTFKDVALAASDDDVNYDGESVEQICGDLSDED